VASHFFPDPRIDSLVKVKQPQLVPVFFYDIADLLLQLSPGISQRREQIEGLGGIRIGGDPVSKWLSNETVCGT
jgi:hypothetical protein